ncbi:FKBP-type peptidyl-prolyl cis-trans isomerase [Roseiconus nitratireducens]|uniref:FKBP-type peptidyl-prolyl cis-trans isomerase n=1 Tax=Roseiconus nitratireducens TaxID=2605748 RepID=UPI00137610DA|nr:FKBP-type peptidyl-prolyl cis-trans isomerase [Roseiconus nitratireducens]
MIRRIIVTAAWVTLVGCDDPIGSDSASASPKTPVEAFRDQEKIGGKATLIDVDGSSLEFDPNTCVRGQAGFGWGLGSVQVNVHGRDRGFCIFDYRNEIEGGFQVYRCRAPVDGPPVKVVVDNGSVATSFSLEEAKLIRSGNMHFGPDDDADMPVAMEQQHVPDTSYVNYFADVVEGAGAPVDADSRVTIAYTIYVDNYFATEFVGVERNRSLDFTLGRRQVGRGMETAVRGMKEGGKRRVMIRNEVAPKMSKDLGGVQPQTVLAIEIDLLEVK